MSVIIKKEVILDFIDKSSQKFNLTNILAKNKKIEEFLNVICVISNPCNYKRRIELAKIFITHMEKNKDVRLYVVECIYPGLGQTEYQITEAGNPNHLQLTAQAVLWTKENMVNLAVQKLLPKDFKAFAFIDADLHFNNPSWAEETLKALNGGCDILQPFENGYNLNKANKIDKGSDMLYSTCFLWIKYCMNDYSSVDFSLINKQLWHPGWCWAMTREAYIKMRGLYDFAILGGGDTILVKSIMNTNYMNTELLFRRCSPGFRKSLIDYQQRCLGLRVGYTKGAVHHYYHGSVVNRKYNERWNIIIYYQYNPYLFLVKNECGMYRASNYFPLKMINEIIKYFKERNEDD